MRGIALFGAGVAAGILMTQGIVAQSGSALKLNHVGISVKDFDKELNYYTKTLGFREVFAFKDPDGKPALTYVQLSRDTFLELQPANADRPPGLSHIGVQVDDLKATMSRLESRGVKLEPMRVGRSGASMRGVRDE